MGNAFIHIGLSKTGSTAIQKTLSNNRQNLKNCGFLYPGDDVDHVFLAGSFHQAAADHFYFRTNNISASDVLVRSNAILSEISATEQRAECLILSSEYFAEFDHVELGMMRNFLVRSGYTPKVVCYVRHPVDAAASHIQQNIKMGFGVLSEFLAAPPWQSFEKSIAPSIKAFGEENIIIRQYEAAREIGAPRDFLETIGFSGVVQTDDSPSNKSLSMAGVLLADAHNRLTNENPHIHQLRGYLLHVGGQKFTLPKASISAVREASKRDIEWLSKTFGIILKEPALPQSSDLNLPDGEFCDEIVKLVLRSQGHQVR